MVSEPVHAGGVRRFASPEEASGSPLAEGIFAIADADVAEVIVSGNLVTVVKRSPAPWQTVGKAVGQVIRATLAGAGPAVAPKPAAPATPGADDDALYERVADLFESQVNPMVARHGGRVAPREAEREALNILLARGPRVTSIVHVTLALAPGGR